MWITSLVVILLAVVLLDPVEEVEAGHSRLVIHTPQRVKTIHRYHTSEHYAKDFGYGNVWHHHHKPKKSRWHKGRRGNKGRRGHRKRYTRKIGRRTPFTGGKSYGMYNYARNYRNWTPERYRRRYHDSYSPREDSHEDNDYSSESEEDSSNESKPFENAVQEIDYYAQRNRNQNRGSAYDNYDYRRSSMGNQARRNENNEYVYTNPYQQENRGTVNNHAEVYSTLPDEFINTPNSDGGRFANQNFHNGQNPGFNAHNFNNGPESGFNIRNFAGSQQTHNVFDHQENPFNNRNFGSDHHSHFNKQNVPTNHNSGVNNQNVWGEQESRYNIENTAGNRYNTFSIENGQGSNYNSAPGNVKYNSDSGYKVHENSGGVGSFTTPRPHYDDAYLRAFGAFSYRKSPVNTGNHGKDSDLSVSSSNIQSFTEKDVIQSFSEKDVMRPSRPIQQVGIAHSDRRNNQWFDHGTSSVKDHDIGFLDGMEDINDGVKNLG